MALKDLFKKKEKEERPVNPNTLLGVRVLAVGYLSYCLWSIIKMYMEGGEEAPSLWLLILAIAVLGGGAVFIAVVTIQKIKQLKDEERARLDEEDALLAAQEEAEDEDFEDEDEVSEDEETSEEE